VFQPSTFASRRAEQAPKPPRRIVSLGKTPVRLPGAGRDQPNRIVAVEAFVDADRTSDIFARYEGDTHLEPVVRHVGTDDDVTPLGTVAARPREWAPLAGSAAADKCTVLDD